MSHAYKKEFAVNLSSLSLYRKGGEENALLLLIFIIFLSRSVLKFNQLFVVFSIEIPVIVCPISAISSKHIENFIKNISKKQHFQDKDL
jgi:hypothetical protein